MFSWTLPPVCIALLRCALPCADAMFFPRQSLMHTHGHGIIIIINALTSMLVVGRREGICMVRPTRTCAS